MVLPTIEAYIVPKENGENVFYLSPLFILPLYASVCRDSRRIIGILLCKAKPPANHKDSLAAITFITASFSGLLKRHPRPTCQPARLARQRLLRDSGTDCRAGQFSLTLYNREQLLKPAT